MVSHMCQEGGRGVHTVVIDLQLSPWTVVWQYNKDFMQTTDLICEVSSSELH